MRPPESRWADIHYKLKLSWGKINTSQATEADQILWTRSIGTLCSNSARGLGRLSCERWTSWGVAMEFMQLISVKLFGSSLLSTKREWEYVQFKPWPQNSLSCSTISCVLHPRSTFCERLELESSFSLIAPCSSRSIKSNRILDSRPSIDVAWSRKMLQAWCEIWITWQWRKGMRCMLHRMKSNGQPPPKKIVCTWHRNRIGGHLRKMNIWY